MLMWCESQFTAFNENIRLNATRRSRIESAISAFIEFCHQDKQLSFALAENPFLQGSVATGTAIRPLSNDEFDVDVIYPFRLSAFGNQQPTPKHIIDWFTSRLVQNGFYKPRLIPKPRCARIDYAGDFHVDIIPSTKDIPDHQPYAIPTRDLTGWITNDAIGFANWVRARDGAAGGKDIYGDGRFVRTVRIMKRWRDHFFGEQSAVSSILLTTILGKHDPTISGYRPPLEKPLYPTYQNDAAYMYDMLRLTWSCLQTPPVNAFWNPTLPDEDLARGWDQKDREIFLLRLGSCISHMENSLTGKTEEAAITNYKKAFGETFPA